LFNQNFVSVTEYELTILTVWTLDSVLSLLFVEFTNCTGTLRVT